MAVVGVYFKVAGIYIRMECTGLCGMGRVTERLDPQPGLSQEINGTENTVFKDAYVDRVSNSGGRN